MADADFYLRLSTIRITAACCLPIGGFGIESKESE